MSGATQTRIAEPRTLLLALWRAALQRADAHACLAEHLPPRPAGRVYVVGAGKAAGAMAHALETLWGPPLRGCVVTRYGHRRPTRYIDVLEAAHPVPNASGTYAAQRIRTLVSDLTPDDHVVCLMSGGASALLALPAPGLTLADKQQITRALLHSGAPITQINCVRKHLSAIKGGRLALACRPARVWTYAISDVVGDAADAIGSGPTVADPTTRGEALDIIARYGVAAPEAVRAHLRSAAAETPKPGDPRLANTVFRCVAGADDALHAAAAAARAAGLDVRVLDTRAEGEARELAADHARLVRELRGSQRVSGAPLVLLSGGETTVTVRGGGRGGPNTEYALSLAASLNGMPGVHALAADTDGIDGTDDAAGGFVSPDTLERARARGLDATDHLARNDSYGFFQALDDLLVTGPTGTNVNDFRAILLA